MSYNISIIGCSGALGRAFTQQLADAYPEASIHAFSRSIISEQLPTVDYHLIDYQDEDSIKKAASVAADSAPLDIVIVATGVLHADGIMPEKSLRDLSLEKFRFLFESNTVVPALIAKHFLPHLNKKRRAVFVALSARVGSISDNQLGGWYAYRASKAALNMMIKNISIEITRFNKHAVIVGLHPGTVDSGLSQPFQANVPEGKLFSADYSVKKLLEVLSGLTPCDSGKCFAWDGKEIEP